jgi:hypothetical protein
MKPARWRERLRSSRKKIRRLAATPQARANTKSLLRERLAERQRQDNLPLVCFLPNFVCKASQRR